jgi:hypothetical protein
MHTDLTNDQLIAEPEQTMQLLSEGIGHFIRLALAGYINARPEVQTRMAELLNSADENVQLIGRLVDGRLALTVAVQARDMSEPRPIMTTRLELPPLAERH